MAKEPEKETETITTKVEDLQLMDEELMQVQAIFARCKPRTIFCRPPTCRVTIIVVGLE